MMADVLGLDVSELGSLASRIVVAMLVTVLAFMVNRRVRHVFQRRHEFIELPAYGQALILNVAAIATALIVGTAILALWGITWSTIAAGIGLSTLAIALGLQDVLKSVVGGVAVMLERPFEIGDQVRIKEIEGEVIDIRVRSVVLRTSHGHVAQVPNGLLFSEAFENLSRTETYAYSIVMSGIEDPPATARSTIAETLQKVEDFAHAPDIVIGRELTPEHWSLLWPSRTGKPSADDAQKQPTRRAVVSWQAETEEPSLGHVVEQLSHRYPHAHIEIRKR